MSSNGVVKQFLLFYFLVISVRFKAWRFKLSFHSEYLFRSFLNQKKLMLESSLNVGL